MRDAGEEGGEVGRDAHVGLMIKCTEKRDAAQPNPTLVDQTRRWSIKSDAGRSEEDRGKSKRPNTEEDRASVTKVVVSWPIGHILVEKYVAPRVTSLMNELLLSEIIFSSKRCTASHRS